MITTTYRIAGMTCAHCVRAVTSEFSELDGVHSVAVDLSAGTATVTSAAPLTESAARDAVEEAGYDYLGSTATPAR
jgi:copper chaperone CopZ